MISALMTTEFDVLGPRRWVSPWHYYLFQNNCLLYKLSQKDRSKDSRDEARRGQSDSWVGQPSLTDAKNKHTRSFCTEIATVKMVIQKWAGPTGPRRIQSRPPHQKKGDLASALTLLTLQLNPHHVFQASAMMTFVQGGRIGRG